LTIRSKVIPLDAGVEISFRLAEPGDHAFLLAVYTSTREEEMALTDWNIEQQQAFVAMQFNAQQLHYRSKYPEAEHLIIVLDGKGIGRLYIADRDEGIEILDITILPEHRNKAFGSMIIKELIAEAAAGYKPLRIYVETYNPSLRLFERLGFQKAEQIGYSYLMKYEGT
jgi:ribosomal protein S18 acetylase RimI-like enzyme